MTDLRAVLEALQQNGVEYIVAGGVAAIAHGSARYTQDLEIIYRISSENLNGRCWLFAT
jgi:hypothetical protein